MGRRRWADDGGTAARRGGSDVGHRARHAVRGHPSRHAREGGEALREGARVRPPGRAVHAGRRRAREAVHAAAAALAEAAPDPRRPGARRVRSVRTAVRAPAGGAGNQQRDRRGGSRLRLRGDARGGLRRPADRGHADRRGPHPVVGPDRRGHPLRAPAARVQPHPAPLTRLLHRREGGSHHDPRHERHRGHPGAVPAGPGEHVAAALHADRDRVADVRDEHDARPLRGGLRGAGDDDHHRVVPLGVRPRLPRGARLDRGIDVRSAGEPVGHACGGRAQPTAVQHRQAPQPRG